MKEGPSVFHKIDFVEHSNFNLNVIQAIIISFSILFIIFCIILQNSQGYIRGILSRWFVYVCV